MRGSSEQSTLKHIGFFSDFSYMYFHISFLVFGLKKADMQSRRAMQSPDNVYIQSQEST